MTCLFLTTSLYAAPITYQGKGSALFPKTQRKYSCHEVFLRFEILPTKLKLIEGGYNCPPLSAAYDYFVFDIKDGKLLTKGEEVGTISEEELNLYQYDPADDSHFHLNWKFSGKKLEYTETWDEGNVRALEVKAILSR